MTNTNTLQDITNFIRENRSNETNFEILHQRLRQAIIDAKQQNDSTLHTNLIEIQEKYATEYLKVRKTLDSAWPEFEKFVSHFERSINAEATNK